MVVIDGSLAVLDVSVDSLSLCCREHGCSDLETRIQRWLLISLEGYSLVQRLSLPIDCFLRD